MRGLRRVAVACVVAAVIAGCSVAGCSTAAPPPAAPPPATPPPAAPPPAAPTPDDTVCREFGDTGSLVRRTAESLARMPVLPAAVALVLLNTRGIATTPGVGDPVLQAAQTELVAAIDDLAAQGQALLGPDGNPARDAVQLDAARILTAVEEIERVCGSRGA